MSIDSFGTLSPFANGDGQARLFSLPKLAKALGITLDRLPYCLRVLLENLLRHEDGDTVLAADIEALARSAPGSRPSREVGFFPSRVLMPDSSGVPAICDLAGMRDEVAAQGGDPRLIDTVIPVDVVIDHSVMVDFAGVPDAVTRNMALEFRRARERYAMLRWSETAFAGLRIVPPGNGILHQINLEYLATVVSVERQGTSVLAIPDTLVGTDSHTPMINGLGVLGWGVGGIEAASAMLGQPISMLIPAVVGCRLTGHLRPGVTATDLVLHLTAVMRGSGVTGCFVEFCGAGLDGLPVADRATIANMAVEWGATLGFFPIDGQTITYLAGTARAPEQVQRVSDYAHAQQLWRGGAEPAFDRILEVNLGTVLRCLAGPRRPDQRVRLADASRSFLDLAAAPAAQDPHPANGDIVIAAITSCTNTSNPAVMLAAGLLARNATALGLRPRRWVKTSLSPGSRRVSEYLEATGLQASLDALGFQPVGYGCMTCMGNSGPLAPEVEDAIHGRAVTAVAVLSGNRNFEGRVHPLVRASYLASPPLVIAYAIAGSILIDLETEPLGQSTTGQTVYLRDIWPSDAEIAALTEAAVTRALFAEGYRDLFHGPALWRDLHGPATPLFPWDAASTYLRRPPYTAIRPALGALPHIRGARPIAILGDDITTDHIAPVGAVPADSAVAAYLQASHVAPDAFDSLASRRANAEIVARTAFSNIRLRNLMAEGSEGSVTTHQPSGELMRLFEASERYRSEGTPLIIVAGANYGMGSSRDTAAKAVQLIGVRAVLAESFERIHRSNLVGMGVMPLQFQAGTTRAGLALDGDETFDILGLSAAEPLGEVCCLIHRSSGRTDAHRLHLRIDTSREMAWCKAGGILPFVGGSLARAPTITA
ncbi:aconitate hydratase AcnA [Acidisoma cellulosilytica]|uniref:Aconitate hydratase n=1 Tax=Acidisoma cellulosilyticum TaxID=2802395 RepID=A0A963Z5X3_9PROT|nr:aconitate hydratase AcnA [Acidisoma cellulosilyticum]MCB8882635.1 aconitate hydratase AcnA [Acidisoma cellulosilyticum]